MKSPVNNLNPTVGVLVDTASGWGRRLVEGVLQYERDHTSWDIWIVPHSQGGLPSLPSGWRGDGILAHVQREEMVAPLVEAGVPVVNVCSLQIPGAEVFPRVTTDYQAWARLAYEYFANLGFRHFAFVAPIEWPYVLILQQTYKDILSAHQHPLHVLTPPEGITAHGQWDEWMDALESWLISLPKPVGLFGFGWIGGSAVIQACARAQLSVPYDVAILGSEFDSVLSNVSHPRLSGVQVPADQIGARAARMLQEMMNGESLEETQVYLPPVEVIAQASTDTLAVEDPQLVKALAYIRQHACENIQVDDILNQVPMARRSLERKFQRAIGRTPYEEIRRLRINKARSLLAQSDLLMQEIAESCGYATYNYLTYAFKRETGSTPSEYRKRSRNP